MKTRAFQLVVLLLLLGFAVHGTQAEVGADVEIIGLDYFDDSHKELLVALQVYLDVSLIDRIEVAVLDPETQFTRTTAPFDNPRFDSNDQIRLRVPVRNLPEGAYFLRIQALDSSGELVFETSADFAHTLLITPIPMRTQVALPQQASANQSATATAQAAASQNSTQPGTTTPSQTIPILLGVVVAAAAGVGGYVVLSRRNRRAEIVTLVSARTVSPEAIFISYSRRDWDDFVEPLSLRLTEAGIPFWLDQHLLKGGDDWMDRIGEALRTCERCILCVSPDSLSSRYVKLEYRYFFNHSKTIYPLICHEVDLPAELQGIQYYHYDELGELIVLLKQWERRPQPATPLEQD